MSNAIMSRFDLFFVVTDECNEVEDYNIARHIVQGRIREVSMTDTLHVAYWPVIGVGVLFQLRTDAVYSVGFALSRRFSEGYPVPRKKSAMGRDSYMRRVLKAHFAKYTDPLIDKSNYDIMTHILYSKLILFRSGRLQTEIETPYTKEEMQMYIAYARTLAPLVCIDTAYPFVCAREA